MIPKRSRRRFIEDYEQYLRLKRLLKFKGITMTMLIVWVKNLK